ncbi:MAG: isopentenyl-diphosphate delta-isomerase [Alteromonadaceae bacterium]|nr:MAG: isopentenyl-diphosphate delta-isomerase [Alteromonadaceae bacterium]
MPIADNTLDNVILVNPEGEAIGTYPKLQAHLDGKLHRAFSIFIFNAAQELLIHQRNPEKYHSGGLWTNTCCSHPREGETVIAAANRRLQEEMGFHTPMRELFTFIYRESLANGLVENEYDHVLIGHYEAAPKPDPSEVSDWRWMSLPALQKEIQQYPEMFTCWLPLALQELLSQHPQLD